MSISHRVFKEMILLQTGKWTFSGKVFVAFYDAWYQDYVIEFSRSFPTEEEAKACVDEVYQSHLREDPMGK